MVSWAFVKRFLVRLEVASVDSLMKVAYRSSEEVFVAVLVTEDVRESECGIEADMGRRKRRTTLCLAVFIKTRSSLRSRGQINATRRVTLHQSSHTLERHGGSLEESWYILDDWQI